MIILVTGGAGFIGSHTVDLLLEQGHKVIVIDNLSSGSTENLNPKANFYKEDLGNFEKISEIFEKEKPEAVYHFAAQIDVRKSLENPVADAEINIINTLNLLQLCVKNNIKHFIFSSSGGAIYDNSEIPASESTNQAPISPYGCAKLTIEKYLNFYNFVHGLKYTCLRYSNVYGPRQSSKGEAGVISIFINNMLSKKNIIIFGGSQTRDFVYVKDVARANVLALNDLNNGIYNIGTEKETDITSLFNIINNFFENKFNVEYKPLIKGEVERSCLSYEKIKNVLGWTPIIQIEQGLKETYLYYLKSLNIQ
ncbi:MAG: NAD-dependent epimerase/dehydratase family protein [Candidatus Pacearchaeota archaeon]|jgi:UDP-glucose 4-epimerase